jgi:hypothetical protein
LKLPKQVDPESSHDYIHIILKIYGEIFMSTANIKEEARRLIDKLPEDITWDDLMHEIYVRQSIEAGLADSKEGKVTDVAEVRARFGLQP